MPFQILNQPRGVASLRLVRIFRRVTLPLQPTPGCVMPRLTDDEKLERLCKAREILELLQPSAPRPALAAE